MWPKGLARRKDWHNFEWDKSRGLVLQFNFVWIFGKCPRIWRVAETIFFFFGQKWVIRPMRQVSQFRVGVLAVKLHLSKCVSECSLQLIYCTSPNSRYFKSRRSFKTYFYSHLVLKRTDSKIISSKQRREHNLRKGRSLMLWTSFFVASYFFLFCIVLEWFYLTRETENNN